MLLKSQVTRDSGSGLVACERWMAARQGISAGRLARENRLVREKKGEWDKRKEINEMMRGE